MIQNRIKVLHKMIKRHELYTGGSCIPGITFLNHENIAEICRIRISEFTDWLLGKDKLESYEKAPSRIFDSADFRTIFLSCSEMVRLNGFKTLKKQIEWMCGRFAAKILAIRKIRSLGFERASIFMPEIRVSTTDMGAPYITDLPECTISISHSNDFAAAAITNLPGFRLGIDIERIRPVRSENFMNLAFSKNEKVYLDSKDDKAIIEGWSMKEAVLKLIGKGFHQPLAHTEILDDTVLVGGCKMPGVVMKRLSFEEEYILSLAYEKK